jgi:hypothetical protein
LRAAVSIRARRHASALREGPSLAVASRTLIFDGFDGVCLRYSSFMPSRKDRKIIEITDTYKASQAIKINAARTQNLQSLNCCAPHNN